MKQKAILVFYIGVKGFRGAEMIEYLESVRESVYKSIPKDMHCFFLASHDMKVGQNKLECINPVPVEQTDYDLILDKLKEIQKTVDDWVDGMKKYLKDS